VAAVPTRKAVRLGRPAAALARAAVMAVAVAVMAEALTARGPRATLLMLRPEAVSPTPIDWRGSANRTIGFTSDAQLSAETAAGRKVQLLPHGNK
jgi:hypothetical protein